MYLVVRGIKIIKKEKVGIAAFQPFTCVA